MLAPLTDVHAFDKGDVQQMLVLEGVRGKLIRTISDHPGPFSRMYMDLSAPKYREVDSKDTLFGQAADIAAGIASMLFQREGISALVTRFEHVTYNGQRMCQADIAEVLAKIESS
jgi:hypothetical protein